MEGRRSAQPEETTVNCPEFWDKSYGSLSVLYGDLPEVFSTAGRRRGGLAEVFVKLTRVLPPKDREGPFRPWVRRWHGH